MTPRDRKRRAKAPALLVLFFLATVSHPKISLADDPASGDGEAELAKKLQNPAAERAHWGKMLCKNWRGSTG